MQVLTVNSVETLSINPNDYDFHAELQMIEKWDISMFFVVVKTNTSIPIGMLSTVDIGHINGADWYSVRLVIDTDHDLQPDIETGFYCPEKDILQYHNPAEDAVYPDDELELLED